MKNLYYATFENGFAEIIKQVLKKQDKNVKVKTLYENAVLFFADEHFKFKNSCFYDAFVVLFNTQKSGVGAINITMKNLLEKKDLKINFAKDTSTFKLTITKENENTVVDNKLKNAFEVMLKKATKKGISYFSENELMLLSKKDGETLFMKRLETGADLSKNVSKYDMKGEMAYLLNFMSEPSASEVVLDPFSSNGVISYVRALCFKKANVIANEEDEEKVKNIKKLSKSLKENHFSVLNYSFFSSEFPIHFIDKIVTDLTNLGFAQVDDYKEFFEKAFELKVKTMVVALPKNYQIENFVKNKFEVETQISAFKVNVYKLKIRG